MSDDAYNAEAASDIGHLRLDVEPMSPDATVTQAADLFLLPANAGLLSLPVVDDGRVTGSISRHQLNNIFLRR
ncbi:MAG TPA: CBS domain-containing protein, partial [Nevskiaceae bacterium]|nr:CBS domain-containing protein [Nevskiaceae bacterium]